MTLNSEAILAVVAMVGTVIVTAAGGGWWLRNQFSDVKNKFYDVMKEHEEKDQKRHEENLWRFGDMNTRLTIIEKNGRPNRFRVAKGR